MKTYTQEQVEILLSEFNPEDFEKFLNDKGLNGNWWEHWELYSDFIEEYIESWHFN